MEYVYFVSRGTFQSEENVLLLLLQFLIVKLSWIVAIVTSVKVATT